jgi:hypothetical protein
LNTKLGLSHHPNYLGHEPASTRHQSTFVPSPNQIKNPIGSRGYGKMNSHFDRVLHIEEIALLLAILEFRFVAFENLDLSRFVEPARRP